MFFADMVPVEDLVPRTSLHAVEHALLVPGQNAGIELEDPVGYIAVPVGIGIIAVSYTHLDVYKRQPEKVVSDQKEKLAKNQALLAQLIESEKRLKK